MPFGFTPATLPQEACTLPAAGSTNSTCKAPYLQCNTARQACTCADGVDTCFGYCIDTPCGACNKCVANVRSFTDAYKSDSDKAVIADAWTPFCTNTLKHTATSCEFVRAQILSSTNGNIGKRAGMICSLLQECASIPSDCRLVPALAGASPSPLDLCTVGGTAAGLQVPGVQSTASFVPEAGSCLDTSHCSSKPGRVCNKQITTDMPTCGGGVDGYVTVGVCERTREQTCKVSGLLGSVTATVDQAARPEMIWLQLCTPHCTLA